MHLVDAAPAAARPPAPTPARAAPATGPDTLADVIDTYRWLVRHGPADVTEVAGEATPDTAAALLAHGLATRSGNRLVPVPPAAAMERVLVTRQEQLAARLDALRRAHQDLLRLHDVAGRGRCTGGGAAWRVLAGDETAALAGELLRSARQEVRDVWTASALPAPGSAVVAVPAGVPYRVVCGRGALHAVGDDQAPAPFGHAQVRLASGVTACLRIVDRRHVLVWPLRSSHGGADGDEPDTGGTYFDSPAIAAAVHWLFDALWASASGTFRRTRPGGLTDAQWRMLRLMTTGMDDAALAAATGTTVRTVRAHIAAVLAALGVPTRFAAGVEAARRGWL